MKTGVTVVDRMRGLDGWINSLTKRDVLVGVPSKNADRKESGEPINNALIGYIMENGSPAQNIPARPHLIPGIEAAQPKIIKFYEAAAEAAFRKDQAGVDRNLNAAGIVAVSSVRGVITAGIAPALSDATLAARARRVKSRKAEAQEIANRAAGKEPSVDLVKPLIDTGDYLKSITYVVRKK